LLVFLFFLRLLVLLFLLLRIVKSFVQAYYGEGYVRFGLIENEHRTRQAIRSIKRMIKNDGFA